MADQANAAEAVPEVEVQEAPSAPAIGVIHRTFIGQAVQIGEKQDDGSLSVMVQFASGLESMEINFRADVLEGLKQRLIGDLIIAPASALPKED